MHENIRYVHTAARLLIATICIIGLIVLLAGCGEDTDAGRGTRDTGDAKAIINMPNHFNNVALKCRGTTGVYVTNNNGDGGTGSDVAVLANDPECKN